MMRLQTYRNYLKIQLLWAGRQVTIKLSIPADLAYMEYQGLTVGSE